MPTPCDPLNLETLQTISTMVASNRSVGAVLDTIVHALIEHSDAALARIWLVKPGDICNVCPMRAECPDQTRCLHLAATAYQQQNPDSGGDWHKDDGFYRRYPMGIRRIGWIAERGESLHLSDTAADSEWFARSDWLNKEGVKSFDGHPLIFREEVLGVLAVFRRSVPQDQECNWLRSFADQATVAIANARAFEEIENLKRRLELENAYLREEVLESHSNGDLIGHSPAMRNIVEQIDLVAATDASVLILGESGTGKELVAREIHQRSQRKDRPMIKVNCASIPRELYESEFFGHTKGAFTGAVRDREGRFELADGGTLFLDEVGEIPLDLQSKLLRVLQEGQYERIGEEKTRHTDVRLIAATNRDLKADVDAGRFRQDLYYRLNVFPIDVAPLRRRNEDVPPLANHFLSGAAKKLNRPLPRLTPANLLTLQRYDWPGNVRELQNVIERAVITARSQNLQFNLPKADLPPNPPPNAAADSADAPQILTDAEMKHRERENLLAALRLSNHKIYGPDGAAQLLDIKPTTLASRIKKFNIEILPR